jgi:hypothetical protein
MLGSAILLYVAPPLAIDFRAVKTTYKLGEPVVFRAEARNVGKKAVRFVLHGDSAQFGTKSPLIQFEVRPVGGEWALPCAVGCGNSNPAMPQDFVSIAPGASVDVLNGMRWSQGLLMLGLTSKGHYDVRLTIDTTSPIERWLGGPLIPEDEAKAKAALQSLYDEVPKFRWVSKTVRIVVE